MTAATASCSHGLNGFLAQLTWPAAVLLSVAIVIGASLLLIFFRWTASL